MMSFHLFLLLHLSLSMPYLYPYLYCYPGPFCISTSISLSLSLSWSFLILLFVLSFFYSPLSGGNYTQSNVTPSARPTAYPTKYPSAKPTNRRPTFTSYPTKLPTVSLPTPRPTLNPTLMAHGSMTYARGIQYNNTAIDDLFSYGCSVCYNVPYSTATSTADIIQCTGPTLFVGAMQYGASSFLLGAFGSSSEIQTRTLQNVPHFSNGVNWYLTPGQSFGFLDSRASLDQNSADTRWDYSESRLSWHLDTYNGGYRAGAYASLNDDTSFMKSIFNCPGNSIYENMMFGNDIKMYCKLDQHFLSCCDPFCFITCSFSVRLIGYI